MSIISKNPLVSVIVPIYNAEKSIGKCIESILKQSLENIELILINDGSNDLSGSICDKYALKDNRIIVIHKNNEGVAATRMIGINIARGKYSIQVDSDDWIESSMLKDLYDKATKENADVVICDFISDYEDKKHQRYHVQQPSGLKNEDIIKNLLMGEKIKPYCWNKLIRHACYSKYNIQIPSDISHGEDFYLNLALFKNNDLNISYLPKAYYHYVQGKNSNFLTHRYTEEDFERDVRLKNHCLKLMSNHPLYAMVEKRNAFHIVRRAFNSGIFSSTEFKKRTYEYRNLIKSYRYIVWHRRYRLYFSCIGAYQIMSIYKIVIKWIKNINLG